MSTVTKTNSGFYLLGRSTRFYPLRLSVRLSVCHAREVGVQSQNIFFSFENFIDNNNFIFGNLCSWSRVRLPDIMTKHLFSFSGNLRSHHKLKSCPGTQPTLFIFSISKLSNVQHNFIIYNFFAVWPSTDALC